MTATERLAEIKARTGAATEGPWDYQPWSQYALPSGDYAESILLANASDDGEIVRGLPDADAEFIANARTDVPALVAALEAVLELHQPDWSDWGLDHPDEGANCSCGHNGDYEDCPTVQAVNEALGVDQ